MRGIEFTEEQYVRLYTRDSVGWMRLGWEAQAVYMGLKRKLDRVGLLQCDGEAPADAASAVLVGWPFEVVEKGIETMLNRGWLEHLEEQDALFDPQHMEAEEAAKSNALRCKESRERRRDRARAEQMGLTQNVSEVTRNVSDHEVTQKVSQATRGASDPTQNESITTRDASEVTQIVSPEGATQIASEATHGASSSTRNVSHEGVTQIASDPTRSVSPPENVTQNASEATQKCRNRRSVTQRDALTCTSTHTREEDISKTRAGAREAPFYNYSDEELSDLTEALVSSGYPLAGVSRYELEREMHQLRHELPPREVIFRGLRPWIDYYKNNPDAFVMKLYNWFKRRRWEAPPPSQSSKNTSRSRVQAQSSEDKRARRRGRIKRNAY